MTRRSRCAPTSSESARCAMIWRMDHFPGAGTKSTSSPAAPVSTVASTSAPRRKRSRSSAREFISVVIGAAHEIAALLALQLASPGREAGRAYRAVEHRLLLLARRRVGPRWLAPFHSTIDYKSVGVVRAFWPAAPAPKTLTPNLDSPARPASSDVAPAFRRPRASRCAT